MNEPKFPILGSAIPQMLGRIAIMRRLWNDLTKTTPNNLSIVGPRFVGKSVILNELAKKCSATDSPYTFVIHWPLGQVSPQSNEQFIAELSDLLRKELLSSGNAYAEHRECLESRSFTFLKEVTDSLDSDNKSILMLWDGFDKPLGQGQLTGQLWDQLRTIFYGKRHKIVTATRLPLSELLRSQAAISSPFWNIFDMTPVRVESFDAEECDAIIASLPEITFQQGARTELSNWSSCYPPMFLELLNQVALETPRGSIDNEKVNAAAIKAVEKLEPILSTLWRDCPASSQDLWAKLSQGTSISLNDINKADRNCLTEKGFARVDSNKLSVGCRMLQHHLRDSNTDTGSMARLFGEWENYQSNIRGVLERRLGHIKRFDSRLFRLVEIAIQDIPNHPDDCLNNLTHIQESALDVIWHREFGPKKTIPSDVFNYLSDPTRYKGEKPIKKMMDENDFRVPSDRGLQVGLLQLLTGSKNGFESKAKTTSKNTYVLINAIHSFRNRNQHADGEAMDVGVAVAGIMICLELLACLDCEIQTA